MPGGDRTGPEGLGPMTGRSLGYCSGSNSPGFAYGQGRGFGRGFGRGYFGRGRGFWRRAIYPDPYFEPTPYHRDAYQRPTKKEEKTYLENLIKDLEEEINSIKSRIKELSKDKE